MKYGPLHKGTDTMKATTTLLLITASCATVSDIQRIEQRGVSRARARNAELDRMRTVINKIQQSTEKRIADLHQSQSQATSERRDLAFKILDTKRHQHQPRLSQLCASSVSSWVHCVHKHYPLKLLGLADVIAVRLAECFSLDDSLAQFEATSDQRSIGYGERMRRLESEIRKSLTRATQLTCQERFDTKPVE